MTIALERSDEGGNHAARGQCAAPRDDADPLAAPPDRQAPAACAHDLGDGGGTALHPRGCPAHRLRPRPGYPGAFPFTRGVYPSMYRRRGTPFAEVITTLR